MIKICYFIHFFLQRKPDDWNIIQRPPTYFSYIGGLQPPSSRLVPPVFFFKIYLVGGSLLYNIVVVFAIHWYESAMGVHVFPILNPPLPPPSPSHPSGSSQCASPEHPVTCIEPGLAICFTYDNIHVSMLFSQIIPPLPSPTQSKRLFFTSVSFFCCLTYRVIITIFLNSIYMH